METNIKLENSIQAKVTKIIFISLIMDLLAFTIPLPLFPRLIASFIESEEKRGKQKSSLLSKMLYSINRVRSLLSSNRSQSMNNNNNHNNNNNKSSINRIGIINHRKNWDVTILGGILGSIFSFCQFLVSPYIGKLSDRHGRKTILMITMIGNIISTILWFTSTSFDEYLLSRIIGGCSEGNIQLSLSIISDVSNIENRSKSLALIGLAFSICFTLGPSLGAWFSNQNHYKNQLFFYFSKFGFLSRIHLNLYSTPAAFSLLLLIIETLYLWFYLPETLHFKQQQQQIILDPSNTENPKKSNSNHSIDSHHLNRLGILTKIHTWFLFFFSVTYDLYGFSNSENGRLLGYIGILSSIIQGGYTRRTKRSPIKLVKSGIIACSISFLLLSYLPYLKTKEEEQGAEEDKQTNYHVLSMICLYCSISLLAYVSGIVVNLLNTLVSLECDSNSNREDQRGKIMGKFRSAGQLGRSIGPIFVTGLYWFKGPSLSYGLCSLGVLLIPLSLLRSLESLSNHTKSTKIH